MLTKEDNDLLCRVGPGTPMGELMRRFWMPAVMSEELPEPDGKPVKVRLLGEDLVAFRDTEGRVGLLDARCPHRRASMALAANEKCGLRCLYHGWKFDVHGKCVDTPGEPPNSRIKEVVRAKAYPTVEKGGMIWAYMGPPEQRPVFPDYEFLNMAPGHSAVFKIQEECNYAQAVEGTIDTVHAGALHRSVRWDDPGTVPHEQVLYAQLEVEPTQYGFRYAGLRALPDGRTHTRITQVTLPFFTFIPPDGTQTDRKHRRLVNAFVPRDDTTTWHTQWFFDQARPIDVAFRLKEGGLQLNPDYTKKIGLKEEYGQDRERMKTKNFSGIVGVVMEDHAVVESQGVITDRENEHLGQSDVAIVTWRRILMKAARTLAETGKLPPALANPAIPWGDVKGVECVVDKGKGWREEVPLAPEFAL
ncbi:MAG: aromatic ring-hydroxylating dioxygenase subunit alpha [Hyphomonadaceae bacterium]|nr:aromatic ring-hydroxylating dioxygenase subunit alpha [Hyphomonadaceae bacterium]